MTTLYCQGFFISVNSYRQHIRQILLGLIIICLSIPSAYAQTYFDYHEEIQKVYQDILQFKFEEASGRLFQLSETEPDNLAIVHLENYIDFYQIFILEETDAFNSLKNNKQQRISLIEKAEDSDPYKLFVLAEIKLQWALARLKFEEYVKAGNELYAAYQHLETNKQRFPSFSLNNKSLSIIHSLIETIPLPEMLKNIIGIQGSISQGLEEIESLLAQDDLKEQFFYQEAEAINTYILFYQANQAVKAMAFLKASSLNQAKDPVSLFLFAKIAQRSGENDEVIKRVQSYLDAHPDSPFSYLYFLLGSAKLNRLDLDADKDILKFLASFKGRHYIKEAYQKLAWYELAVNNNLAGYKSYMSSCLINGNAIIDGDLQAEHEAKSLHLPQVSLLKARLLYDGSYYNQAYDLLIKKAHEFYPQEQSHLEYFYRLARVTQALANYREAIEYYETILSNERYNYSYLSCNAALQCGLIFEAQRKWEEAEDYYTKCLGLKPDKYKNSLHQKAKSGLARIDQKSK